MGQFDDIGVNLAKSARYARYGNADMPADIIDLRHGRRKWGAVGKIPGRLIKHNMTVSLLPGHPGGVGLNDCVPQERVNLLRRVDPVGDAVRGMAFPVVLVLIVDYESGYALLAVSVDDMLSEYGLTRPREPDDNAPDIASHDRQLPNDDSRNAW